MKRSTKIGIGAGGALALAGAALATGMTITSASADETPTPTPSSSTAPERTRGMDETPLTGDDATRATAAAESAVEGGTVLRVETDANDGGTYEAHVRTSEGTEVIVTMDEDFNLIEVKELAGRGGHGPGHDRDGDDAGADSSGSSSDSSSSSSASSASLSVDI